MTLAKLVLPIGSLVLVSALAACQLDPGDASLATEAHALASCSSPPRGAGSVCDLGGGRRQFQVTLPSGQKYVEVFVRQNGIQNVARAIQGNGTPQANGTTTYSFVGDGYAAGDAVEYRYYSYLPDAPGVFTPGPIEQRWYRCEDVPVEQVAEVPVGKDAAVIYASLGVGPAADRNFGGAATVDIGEYHLTSEGLFGYALAGIVPAGATITRAELVIPAAYVPGASTVTLRLNRVTSSWSEATVTWNTRPSYQLVREVSVTSGVENRIDVTEQVVGAITSGEIGFALQPSSSAPTVDNVFIDAKEKSGGHPTSLAVRWTD